MEISKSIFGLAKNNNGFFKSEKQAQFLISQIDLLDGLIGYAEMGYNSCPIYADTDKNGITKISKRTVNGLVVMFERKQKGVLTSLEIQEIKRRERKIKSLEKEVIERQECFDNGNYNNSGDVNTYTIEMINQFNSFQNQKIEQINRLKEIVYKLKNNN